MVVVMVFLKPGGAKNRNTGPYKVKGTKAFNELPEDAQCKSKFITATFGAIEVNMLFCRNYSILR
jgi:hypothetical protein